MKDTSKAKRRGQSASTASRPSGRAVRKTASKRAPSRGVPEIAALLVDARRKDLDALERAGAKSYAGMRAVVRRHVTQLKEALGEWQAVFKVMQMAGPRESAARLDELGRGAFRQAMFSIRELAELTVQGQAQAVQVIKQRIDADLDELNRMLEQRPR